MGEQRQRLRTDICPPGTQLGLAACLHHKKSIVRPLGEMLEKVKIPPGYSSGISPQARYYYWLDKNRSRSTWFSPQNCKIGICSCPGNIEDDHQFSGFNGPGGELSSFPVLRNAGVTGFQSSAEYSSQAHGCPATGAQAAFHGDCSAWPGLVWPGSLNGWELACRHSAPHLASLRHAHHSSLPAPPSASGRPGLGAVGRQLSAWRLAVESNKDVGVFGSPAAEDETASDFGEQARCLELF